MAWRIAARYGERGVRPFGVVVNVDEDEASIEELLDCQVDDLAGHVAESATDLTFRIRGKRRDTPPVDHLAVTAEAKFGDQRMVQYESGTIAIEQGGVPVAPVLPVLRNIAAEVGVSLLNQAGGPRNTRQLGAEIIAVLSSAQRISDPVSDL